MTLKLKKGSITNHHHCSVLTTAVYEQRKRGKMNAGKSTHLTECVNLKEQNVKEIKWNECNSNSNIADMDRDETNRKIPNKRGKNEMCEYELKEKRKKKKRTAKFFDSCENECLPNWNNFVHRTDSQKREIVFLCISVIYTHDWTEIERAQNDDNGRRRWWARTLHNNDGMLVCLLYVLFLFSHKFQFFIIFFFSFLPVNFFLLSVYFRSALLVMLFFGWCTVFCIYCTGQS